MNYGDPNFIEITQHVERVEPVELVMSSMSSRAVRQAWHSQNAWARHVERVESCRVETWRVKWNFGCSETHSWSVQRIVSQPDPEAHSTYKSGGVIGALTAFNSVLSCCIGWDCSKGPQSHVL